MKRDEVFPSRFLKAADLGGKPVAVTIKSVTQEKLKNGSGDEETKTVVYFEKAKKGLILNITNWDKIVDITGEADTNDWPSHRIEVFPTTTEMRGKTVDCIRIRKPPQGELPVAKPPAPKPVARPSAPKSSVDEMDDAIPF